MSDLGDGSARRAKMMVVGVGVLVTSGLTGCFDDDRSQLQGVLTGLTRTPPATAAPAPVPAATPGTNTTRPVNGSTPAPIPTSSAPPITAGVPAPAPAPSPTPTPAPSPSATPAPTSPAPAPSATPAPAPNPPPPPQPATGSATLSWDAPTENIDGTPLASLSVYNVLYGTDAGALDKTVTVASAGITRYVVEPLAKGTTYYFAVTALATGGVEGLRSEVVSKTIQ